MHQPSPAMPETRIHQAGWTLRMRAPIESLTWDATQPEHPVFAHISGATRVKSSPFARVWHAEWNRAQDSFPIFFKEFLHRSWLDSVKYWFRPSRTERAIAAEQLLSQHGFAAPETVLYGWRGRWPWRHQFFAVTRAIENSQTLVLFLRNLPQPGSDAVAAQRKRRFINELAQLIRRLHELRIYHGDLRAANLLITPAANDGWQFHFLDNERTRQFRRPQPRLQQKNLVQLNMLAAPGLTRTDRLRFLLAYSGQSRLDAPTKRLARRIATITHARQTLHARERQQAQQSRTAN